MLNREYMTPEQFVYWLQGYFEITDETTLTSAQIKCIKNHLSKIFNNEPEPIKIKWINYKEPNPLVLYNSNRSCGLSSVNDYPYRFISS
jgi:hypothetical protein